MRYGSFGCLPFGKFRAPYIERCVSTDGRNRLLTELHFDARRMPHREPQEGPAIFLCHPSGQPKVIEYRWHGFLHRDGGPASLVYEADGTLMTEEWSRFGRCHRKDGPAYMHREGSRVYYQWWLHGYNYRDPTFWSRYDQEYELDDDLFDDWVMNQGPPRHLPTRRQLRRHFGEIAATLGG
jgi:hypothetical protein